MISETTIIVCPLVAIIIIQLIIIYKTVARSRKLLDQKNVRLIQHYFDTKFISKIILESVNTSNAKEFCKIASEDIIKYYNLEDIIITSMGISAKINNSYLRNDVMKFINEHEEQIENLLQNSNFVKVKLESDSRKLQLYISPLKDSKSKELIICIENAPVLLNDNELLGMENCINLLKTRLIHT